jgi:hypothetical protein
MDPQRAVRLLTIGSLFLGGISVAASFAENDLLPEPLREWNADQSLDWSPPTLIAVVVFLVLIIFAWIVASVALLQLKKWGAWLHLGTTLVGLAVLPFFGPFVIHGVSYVIESLGALVNGCLYGVAFFSTALDRPKTSDQPPLTP